MTGFLSDGVALSVLATAAELMIKIIPMLGLAVFLAEVARIWLGEEKLKAILTGRHEWTGRLRAVALGALLPFCECGAFPVMIGLIRAGVPSATVLTFFLISPVVSLPAFMILISVFGLPLALAYLLVTITGALLAIRVIEPLGRRWGIFKAGIVVSEDLKMANQVTACGSECGCSGEGQAHEQQAKQDLIIIGRMAMTHTSKLIKRMLPYLVLVVIASALLSNFVPPTLIESILLSKAPFDVLIGALVGIPVYAGDCAMIALAAPLIGATGAVAAGVAFIISGSGTSISGIIFMSSVFQRKFLVIYVLAVFAIALFAGFSISILLSFGIL